MPPPSASSAGKKRALPTWGQGTASGGWAKKTPPGKTASPPNPASLFTPSYARSPSSEPKYTHPVVVDSPIIVEKPKRSEPWTSEVVLKAICEAGSAGATLEVKNMCVPLSTVLLWFDRILR